MAKLKTGRPAVEYNDVLQGLAPAENNAESSRISRKYRLGQKKCLILLLDLEITVNMYLHGDFKCHKNHTRVEKRCQLLQDYRR